MTSPTQKQPQSSLKPAIFAGVLIALVLGFFLFKKNSLEKKSQEFQLQQMDLEAQKENEFKDIEVDLIFSNDIVQTIRNDKYQLIDIRESIDFDEKHIESSINIPLSLINQRVSSIDKSKKIVIIDGKNTTEGKVLTDHFKKEGLDIKYLDGGIEKYIVDGFVVVSKGDVNSVTDKVKTKPLEATKLQERVKFGDIFSFLDVRSKSRFDSSHIQGAVNIPLEELEKRKSDLPLGKIMVYDDTPERAFQAAVKLYDMNVLNVYYLSDSLEDLKKLASEENQTK